MGLKPRKNLGYSKVTAMVLISEVCLSFLGK